MQVVLAAGGHGTRMRSVLGDLPKVLAPIDGKPFLAVLIERFTALGATSVHLLLGHAHDRIQQAVAGHVDTDVTVTSTVENQPRGVVGALADARPALAEEFIFGYGDVYPVVDGAMLTDLMSAGEAAMVVADPVACGEPANVTVTDGMVTGYGREPSATALDAGLLCLRRSDLDSIDPARDRVDEAEFYPTLLRDGLRAVPQSDATIHIGDPNAYRRALSLIPTLAHRVMPPGGPNES